MRISKFALELRYKPVYECAACHALKAGTQVRVTASGHTFETLEQNIEILKRQRLRSADMPYGWSFNGDFLCERCPC